METFSTTIFQIKIANNLLTDVFHLSGFSMITLISNFLTRMKGRYALLAILTLVSCSQKKGEQPTRPTNLPSALIDGRFYLKIPTLNGDTILGFCDTGGGYTAIYNSPIRKLHLESEVKEVAIQKNKIKYIFVRDIYRHPDIPYPHIGRYYESDIKSPFFEVPDDSKESDYLSRFMQYDAFLGQFFFIDHAWTFDYAAGEILINTPLSEDSDDENMQRVGFKKKFFGGKIFGHPSIKLEIDGEVLDFLFDTGASFLLSDSGRIKLHANSKSVAGSFIAKSVFDKWHKNHPDWKIIERGEITGSDLIEVPQVKVGNLTAGPVWFARRPDEAWSEGMIGSMDKVVKGAIGGSYFQYFKITLDYNSELVKFELKKL
jgi:hypothetical protein